MFDVTRILVYALSPADSSAIMLYISQALLRIGPDQEKFIEEFR